MKKIILIFLSLLCISCSTLTAFTQHTANSDDVQKLMAKGALELMTPQERKDYEAGKTVNMIGFQSASRGVVLDKLTSMANLSKGKIDEDVVTAIAIFLSTIHLLYSSQAFGCHKIPSFTILSPLSFFPFLQMYDILHLFLQLFLIFFVCT